MDYVLNKKVYSSGAVEYRYDIYSYYVVMSLKGTVIAGSWDMEVFLIQAAAAFALERNFLLPACSIQRGQGVGSIAAASQFLPECRSIAGYRLNANMLTVQYAANVAIKVKDAARHSSNFA